MATSHWYGSCPSLALHSLCPTEVDQGMWLALQEELWTLDLLALSPSSGVLPEAGTE